MDKSECYAIVKISISKMIADVKVDEPTEDLAHDIAVDFLFSDSFKAFSRDKGRIEDLGCGYAKMRVRHYVEKTRQRKFRYTKLNDKFDHKYEIDHILDFSYRETVQYLLDNIPMSKYRILLRACLEVIQETGKLSILDVAKRVKKPYARIKKEVDSMFLWISTNYKYMGV